MSKKINFISLMICIFFTMNHAQNIEGVNARIDGMAGAGIPDDIGWCFFQPRNFIKYPDYIQGNLILKPYWGTKETFGGIIILKSLGPNVVAGISTNNNLIMGGDFYFRSISFMEASGDFAVTPEDMVNTSLPSFPQIGVNVKITDNINIGALVFGEGIRKKNDHSIIDSSATPMIIDSVRNRKYTNLGFHIDANISLGKIGFAPRIRVGFPKISGEDKSTTVTNETHTADYSSDEGLKLMVGTVAWFVGLKYPIVGGAFFIQEKYKFEKVSSGMNLDYIQQSKAFKNNILFLFIGTEIHFGDGFMFTPELDLEFVNLHLDGLKNNTALQDSVKTFNTYTFRLGMEKKSKKLKHLDYITPRAGLVYKYAQSKSKITDALGNEDVVINIVETNNDKFYQNRGMKLAAGLGITKGRLTLDVSSDLMAWSGTIITGPKAAMLSLTVDIAKNPRYKMVNNNEPIPEPPPQNDEEYSEPIPEPPPQNDEEYSEPIDDLDMDTE